MFFFIPGTWPLYYKLYLSFLIIHSSLTPVRVSSGVESSIWPWSEWNEKCHINQSVSSLPTLTHATQCSQARDGQRERERNPASGFSCMLMAWLDACVQTHTQCAVFVHIIVSSSFSVVYCHWTFQMVGVCVCVYVWRWLSVHVSRFDLPSLWFFLGGSPMAWSGWTI